MAQSSFMGTTPATLWVPVVWRRDDGREFMPVLMHGRFQFRGYAADYAK